MTEIAELMLVVDSRPAEAGAKRTETALGSVGKAAGNLQRTLLGLAGGLGVAKLFGDFTKQTSAFEASLRKIAQLQGLGNTAKALKDVESALKGVRSSFFDRGDLAAGALEATRANFGLADSLKVTAAAQTLARDTGLELAKAVGLTSTALKALGQGAGGAGNIAGALGLVADLDAGGIQELVGVLQKVAPEARQVTVAADELLAAFKIADDEGQSFATTGRDLTGILNALEAPTKESSAALAQLGLTFADIDPRARRLDEIFAKLAQRGASAAQLSDIFGQGNSATASALVRNAEDLAKALEEVRNATSGDGAGGARNISEAIQGIANAYNDLLIAGGNSGAASVVVSTLDTIREALRDIAGVGEGTSAAARALEGLVAGFVAYRVAVGAAAAAQKLFNVAFAGTPFGLIATGLVAATTAAVAFREELGLVEKKVREVSAVQKTPQIGRDLLSASGSALAGASLGGPFGDIAEQSKNAVFALQRSIADATKTALVDGLASPETTQDVLRALENTLKALASDPNRNAAEAAGAILSESLVQGLVGPNSALNADQQDAIRRSIEGIAGGSSASPKGAASDSVDALNAATAAQSRILDAIKATEKAAEAETKQIEALNAAFRDEAALRFERTLLGIPEGARDAFQQIEQFRLALVEAGVDSATVATRTQAYATELHALNEAARSAAGAISDLEGETKALQIAQEAADEAARKSTEARKSAREEQERAAKTALESVTRLRNELEIEADVLGLTAAEAARYRKEIEFADQANRAFGAGSDAATRAIAEYHDELARVDAAREAIQVSRDLAEALVNPVGSALDSTIEKLFRGEAATINFRDALLDLAGEVGKGVFNTLVTKPLTEKATAGLAGVFGNLFGQGDPSKPSPAGVPGQAGAAAAAAVGGAFTPAGVVNIQAAVVNLASGGVPGAGGAGGAGVAGSVQGLAGLASAFGGGNSPTNTPSGTTGTGSALLGVSSLAATAGAGGGGTTSTAAQAQASVQPTEPSSGQQVASVGTGALSGAATGAAVGSVVPGIGTAIGAIAGALLGAAFGYFGTQSRRGNVFAGGRLIPHANGGVVDQFSVFPLRGGRFGTLAEDGPEAILPLRRGRSGRLGVELAGGGRSGGGASRGGDTVVQMTVITPDADSFRKQQSSIAREQRRVERRTTPRRT